MSLPSLIQAGVQRDTLVTVVTRDAFDVILAVAAASVAVLCLMLLAALVIGLLQLWRVTRKVERLGAKLASDPAVHSLRKIGANVESISNTLRKETDRLADSIAGISDQVTLASIHMEERIEEFNALMEVIQSEAERAFVDGAATARGMRTGLDNLRKRPRSEAPGEAPDE